MTENLMIGTKQMTKSEKLLVGTKKMAKSEKLLNGKGYSIAPKICNSNCSILNSQAKGTKSTSFHMHGTKWT